MRIVLHLNNTTETEGTLNNPVDHVVYSFLSLNDKSRIIKMNFIVSIKAKMIW